jgi:hypothetical protein
MEYSNNSPEPTPNLPARTPRHDGWTPDRMAAFLEVLADTGIVSDAARAAGMHRDSAYALRNRDPVIAAAWRAAQAQARPQVADGLLERSITGTVEHYYRDGELVGERRHYESWMTTHAPPPGFGGWESAEWDGFNAYKRACAPEEAALLEAHQAAMIEEERRELDEIARDEREAFFQQLRTKIAATAAAAPLPAAGEGLGRGDADAKASPRGNS